MSYKVALVGHSFISRLEKDMHTRSDMAKDFNLGIELTIKSFYKPGARISNMDEFIPQIVDFKPDILFLQIGGNDIPQKEPEVIAEQILDLSTKLIQSGIKRVYIGQLLKRFEGYYIRGLQEEQEYQHIRSEANKKLKPHQGYITW